MASWSCRHCHFDNPPLYLTCGACLTINSPHFRPGGANAEGADLRAAGWQLEVAEPKAIEVVAPPECVVLEPDDDSTEEFLGNVTGGLPLGVDSASQPLQDKPADDVSTEECLADFSQEQGPAGGIRLIPVDAVATPVAGCSPLQESTPSGGGATLGGESSGPGRRAQKTASKSTEAADLPKGKRPRSG
jgi:hypothetical protein